MTYVPGACAAKIRARGLDFSQARRPRLVTLEDAVRAVVEKHGGVRAAERATGVDKSFISRLMRGEKVNPSAKTLEALGLRAVPLYEVLKTPNVGVEPHSAAERTVMTNQSDQPTNVGSNDQLGGPPTKRYVGGRIVNGCSLHATHKPELCQKHLHRCPEPRTVDCCGVVDEHDIIECSRCGKQWTVPCNFDDDYS